MPLSITFRMGLRKQTISKRLRVESSSPSPLQRHKTTKRQVRSYWRRMKISPSGPNKDQLCTNKRKSVTQGTNARYKIGEIYVA